MAPAEMRSEVTRPERLEALSDEALMDSYYGCNSDALEVLYQRRYGGIFEFFSKLGFGDKCADLAQQTFLNVMQTKEKQTGRFDPSKATFKTWLYRIVFHLAVSEWRKEGRELNIDVTAPGDEGEAGQSVSLGEVAPDSRPSSVDELEAEKFAEAVAACLAALPLHYLIVLVLTYVISMPAAKIADALQEVLVRRVTEDAVHMIALRARQQVKKCLEGKGYQFMPATVGRGPKGPLMRVVMSFEDEVLVHVSVGAGGIEGGVGHE